MPLPVHQNKNTNKYNKYSFTAAKTLIAIAAIGLFVSGSVQLSAHNNALVDYFYDSVYQKYKTENIYSVNSTSNVTTIVNTSKIPNGLFYADSTTTIFFDGFVCSNGNCTPFDDDVWVCDNMRKEIAQARHLTIANGTLMIVACFLTTLSLLSRGIGMLVYFVMKRTFGKFTSSSTTTTETENIMQDDEEPTTSSMNQASCCSCCDQIGYKLQNILLYAGLFIMFVVCGLSIDVIYEGVDLVNKPLCPDSGINPYNVSFSDSPSFSYGRALHLIIASCALTITISCLFFIWLACFICGRVCCICCCEHDDGDDDDEFEEESTFEKQQQQQTSRARTSSLFGTEADFYSYQIEDEEKEKEKLKEEVEEELSLNREGSSKKKTVTVRKIRRKKEQQQQQAAVAVADEV